MPDDFLGHNVERERLREDRIANRGNGLWRRWGPYVSERQWGTVREDYSADGNAWEYVSHEHARSKAYRWGEDGIGGWCDHHQRLCMAPAFWNGRDPILKERLFGLTNGQGNHGEDCKELYYYLDATPTNSLARMLYKYPHAAYPYAELVEENRHRGRQEPEFELIDTGVFDEDRYFDILIEYARASLDTTCVRIRVENKGPAAADFWLLFQAWFRNTWSWKPGSVKPSLEARDEKSARISYPEFPDFVFAAESAGELLFTENETNLARLYGMEASGPFKDAFHDFVVWGLEKAVVRGRGSKCAVLYRASLAAGETRAWKFVLGPAAEVETVGEIDTVFADRQAEADLFYLDLHGQGDAELAQIQREACAGLIWTRQYYHYDVPDWLNGDPLQPKPPVERLSGRNSQWTHLNNADVISMPDKWEYPWYAAWDLGFHAVAFAPIDPAFAKNQLLLMTREWYMHPNGQLPAYEWNLSDVNPPVHAWAALKVFEEDRRATGGRGDLGFLERIFHKLMLNFTWWVNRKDAQGRNIFQGGFLGLDNIGVFDRSAPLPSGGHLDQADGTSWMAMYSLNLMRIALELAQHNEVYEDIATKFFEHFLHIAEALGGVRGGCCGLWNEEDSFFYDVLRLPDGREIQMRVQSLVGLTPLFAVEVLEPDLLEKLPGFASRLRWFLKYRPDLAALVSRWEVPGKGERKLLSLLRGHRMKCLLAKMLDEAAFLSRYGVRSLSKIHEKAPYEFRVDGCSLSVGYVPGESDSGLFGGNSNWRGPIWMPVNYLLIDSLRQFHRYYGDDFRVEFPTGSGRLLSLREIAEELSQRLIDLFRRDSTGRRPVMGGSELLQGRPDFRDHMLFYEYFHGDSGRGLGASHQTGWTALIANLAAEVRRR